jgi:hypothetical protein
MPYAALAFVVDKTTELVHQCVVVSETFFISNHLVCQQADYAIQKFPRTCLSFGRVDVKDLGASPCRLVDVIDG